MDITVLEDHKHRLVFALPGEHHAVCGALVKELWAEKGVKNVSYTTEHPLTGNHKFILETDGADPRKTLSAAAKKLTKTSQKIRDDAAKALK